MSNFTCLNGDCLEIMKTLPNKSIDLFLCDLPYGCLDKKGSPWDVKIDLEKFWVQVKRLCKNDKTPILMFCNTRFGSDLINSNPKWFRYDIVWNKHTGTNFLNAGRQPLQAHEMIYVFSKKAAFYKRIDQEIEGKKPYSKKAGGGINSRCYGNNPRTEFVREDNKRCPLSVINFKYCQDKKHPTTKPIDLLQWLIERYSNEEDTVLDPTAGSFNSGRASISLKRKYIGIEMNKDFYDNNKL